MSKKLTDKERSEMEEALKSAALTDSELEKLAEGVDESGEVVMPVEDGEDLISAAAMALEFVDTLETTGPVERPEQEDAVAGFDALLRKLETLRSDISSLQRGVVGVFAAQLLAFRGKVVELKSRISEEMVERLRMKFFKQFIESTFVDIVDTEFAALEKDLVDKIVEQTQERFKEFALRVRESEVDLRTTIVEQQDVVRSFMQSLEEETASQRQELAEKQQEVTRLESEVRQLQSTATASKAAESAREEYERRVADLETQVNTLRDELLMKEVQVDARLKDVEEAKAEAEEAKMKLGEVQTEFEVYKTEVAAAQPQVEKTEAELEAMKTKADMLNSTLEEKRREGEIAEAKIKDLEQKIADAIAERNAANQEAKARESELDGMQSRFAEIKQLDAKIHGLEKELKETQEKIPILEMQKEAFEKATRLMETERDLALEQRDLSDERTRRYIKVLGMENNTKVLLLVDEVGSITFAELGKSLGTPVGLVTKWARELEKLGVLKVRGEKVMSTLKDIEVKEGEVDID
jgi:chromosome segregation ATPase